MQRLGKRLGRWIFDRYIASDDTAEMIRRYGKAERVLGFLTAILGVLWVAAMVAIILWV